jgi:hypothetical protein
MKFKHGVRKEKKRGRKKRGKGGTFLFLKQRGKGESRMKRGKVASEKE